MPGRLEPKGAACPSCGTYLRRSIHGQLFRCRSNACKDKSIGPCTAIPDCDRSPDGRNGSICAGHAQQRAKGKPFRPLRYKRSSTIVRDEQGRKECYGCRQWLSTDQFIGQKLMADGLGLHCADCRQVQSLIRYYNLSIEDYRRLLAKQGGACAICERVPENRLHVDHDHRCCPEKKRSCGRCVRGLLCGTCNCAIGMLSEDEQLFLRAAAYIKGRSLA